MTQPNYFDVIIVGGSYAGLSAAMALARSLRTVLIIDSGRPCNYPTPHAHNLITHDGETPAAIIENARTQVLQYNTVQFYNGLAVHGINKEKGFSITTDAGDEFFCHKLLFATGVKDLMPPISGFDACWGKSVLHCPYCHGYEVKQQEIGLIGNGDVGFDFSRLLNQWSQHLTLFTNGKSTLSQQQKEKIEARNIAVVEKEIEAFEHNNGYVHHLLFKDRTKMAVTIVFARVAFQQHCSIPESLGCQVSDAGLLVTDDFHQTNVPGVFAAGDNTNPLRALSVAMAAGTKAGAFINRFLIEESF